MSKVRFQFSNVKFEISDFKYPSNSKFWPRPGMPPTGEVTAIGGDFLFSPSPLPGGDEITILPRRSPRKVGLKRAQNLRPPAPKSS